MEGMLSRSRASFNYPRCLIMYPLRKSRFLMPTVSGWVLLTPGTIVTPEGFVGFNAGTLGPAMVEGRISSGVVVDEGSDIGGGASIMGTVSGGGKQVIRVGRNCLLGANSGIGISLGDGCVVEAGCYITAGVPVTMANGTVVKALELAGQDGLLFRRNALTGKIEALEAITSWTGLNPVLHQVTAP